MYLEVLFLQQMKAVNEQLFSTIKEDNLCFRAHKPKRTLRSE